ncbi:unnamed protein product [Allacma fusca]|uniref:Acyltransferase 3 domain-containing protein n=1 Tax=Allacma fusca TaxID=39272 RepID=A0A8J2KLE1_9HEXA|nr:unnamed protein product [Allacma fusca]
MFAIHRYLRLTPAYAVVIGLMATLVPYFGNGPYWFAVEQDQAKCIRHWWQNLLYINNFVKNESDLCYPESWYLANDMQFFLLSPLLIYPLWRFKLIGVGTTCLAAIASIVVSAVVTHQMEWAPTVIYSIPFKNYFVGYYMKPWNRFGTYVVGIVLGYILYLRLKNPTKFKAIPKVVVIVGWILSTFLALGVIFGGMYYFDPKNEEETFTSVHAAIYAGIHRQVFSVSIAWVVFACVTGNGGWVNSLLSWKVFMPLGRLTFCMYITAYRLQLIYHLMQPHPVHLSVYNTVYMFFAHLVMSSLVAFLLTTSVETPFMQLEKLLFASQMQPKVPKPNMVEAAAVDPEDPKIVD